MGKPLRVLIVEDSEDDAQLALRELQKGGFEPAHQRVETAEALSAALEKQSWDVIISDYVMPRFSGPDALKLLQAMGVDIPFIMVSGKITEETAVEVMKAGAHDYLLKDHLARLCASVEQELRNAEVRRGRKRAEEELRSSEARYRSLFDSSSDILVQLDSAGTIVDLNPQAEALGGYKREEMIGKKINALTGKFTAASLALMVANFATRKQGVAIPPYEVEAIDSDGQQLYFEITTSPLKGIVGKEAGEIGIMHNITERKRMETALSDSETKFKSIFDHATDGIILADIETKKFFDANSVMCNLLGYGLDEVRRMGVMEIHPQESLPYVLDQFEKQAKGEITLAKDIPVKRQDGSVVYADISSGPIELSGKHYIMGIFRDITERKRTEEEIKKKLEELEIFYKAAMDREDRILELKKKVEELEKHG
jgi:sigma-B regulation protein RsbU (phosphoserine phosphatase)